MKTPPVRGGVFLHRFHCGGNWMDNFIDYAFEAWPGFVVRTGLLKCCATGYERAPSFCVSQESKDKHLVIYVMYGEIDIEHVINCFCRSFALTTGSTAFFEKSTIPRYARATQKIVAAADNQRMVFTDRISF